MAATLLAFDQSSDRDYSSTNDPGIPLTISGELIGKILCGLDTWDSAPGIWYPVGLKGFQFPPGI